jgi:hypothetical protein
MTLHVTKACRRKKRKEEQMKEITKVIEKHSPELKK